MIEALLDRLRYKSEGTDIDFKSAQYRFVGASDSEKAELLKDILAIANSWREGTGYILVGFRDARPHPAEVVGITDSIDDAALQQFVNSKVTPKLVFSYEEHLYQGKTVGVFAIPKQDRPFSLQSDFARLKRNAAYVRRGSSTDEASLVEVQQMGFDDRGLGVPNVSLKLLSNVGNDELPNQLALKFCTAPTDLPDYLSPSPLGYQEQIRRSVSMERDNHEFWREFAIFVKTHGAAIHVRFVLENRSQTQLTNTKLEALVESANGGPARLMAADDLPSMPRPTSDFTSAVYGRMPKDKKLRVINQAGAERCEVRFGSLLPGEEGYSDDALVIVPPSACQLRLRLRILAAELATPIETERVLDVVGEDLFTDARWLEHAYRRMLGASHSDN